MMLKGGNLRNERDLVFAHFVTRGSHAISRQSSSVFDLRINIVPADAGQSPSPPCPLVVFVSSNGPWICSVSYVHE